MKNKGREHPKQTDTANTVSAPCLNITKLGIVSRDYSRKYDNGYRDFSHTLPDVLKLLDKNGCNAVLFSLFSIIPRERLRILDAFRGLKNIKAVFLEHFQDGKKRDAGRYVVYHRTSKGWSEYAFRQRFATLTGTSKREMDEFVNEEMKNRVLGNCCVLLCGETNGVKYSRKNKRVEDTFGVRATIPSKTNIVLNPIHDRMTRFEMKLKRQFLSKKNRWVISVWNKGKEDKNGNVMRRQETFMDCFLSWKRRERRSNSESTRSRNWCFGPQQRITRRVVAAGELGNVGGR